MQNVFVDRMFHIDKPWDNNVNAILEVHAYMSYKN